ncbi:hypothetical protein DPMN_166065 [Dreissena polymorpha]|uniref:Uncharacterized protein n=1 Tax=Dreissena polymorpha TaxID=45954 RepID=A0A9D4IXK0_DREPO|nr:hypothetical protein DPMN_166065 [Dreissena polymorpha]
MFHGVLNIPRRGRLSALRPVHSNKPASSRFLLDISVSPSPTSSDGTRRVYNSFKAAGRK